MSRQGKEFPSYVIDLSFRRSGGACEQCGSKENIEVHHILPIWVAAQYFPQLASMVLKSAENAKCLCSNCHDELHRRNDFTVFNSQAALLIAIQSTQYEMAYV